MKFNSALQKEMKEKKREESRRSMITQRQGVGLHLHVCANDILEKKWDKLCDMKEEIRKLLLEVTSSSKKQQQKRPH